MITKRFFRLTNELENDPSRLWGRCDQRKSFLQIHDLFGLGQVIGSGHRGGIWWDLWGDPWKVRLRQAYRIILRS